MNHDLAIAPVFSKKCFGFLSLCIVFILVGTPPLQAALLDGLMKGVEESLGEHADKKGEKLILGNFYQAERPDSHGPIGMMGNHTHNEGEFMASYRYMHMSMDGNRSGTSGLSNAQVLTQFPVTPTDMDMDMHMFGFMYGLNQTVTLVAMIPYIQSSMNHVTRMGGRFKTESSGFGDIRLGTLLRLWAFETPSLGAHRFHLNFAVGLPTGDIKVVDNTPVGADSRLPYPMQLGSGTVDLFPGLTYTGLRNDVSWGFQFVQTLRLGQNDQGYSVGDNYQVTSYGAYRWTNWVSTSLRLNWLDWKNYDGADPNLNPMMIHTADINRRGGERLDILPGVNFLFPEFMGYENRLGVEFGVPIYQNLNGPQLETDWTVMVGWQIVK